MKNYKKEFDSLLNQLAYGRGIIQAFQDLLDTVLFHLIILDDCNMRRNPLSNYGHVDKKRMQELIIALGHVMNNDGERFHDAIGDLFMEYISMGKNDQYFTPHNVADVLSKISLPEIIGKTTIDSACGSGRLLLGVAKRNPDLLFYGSDIDLSCVKMAVINLAVNGLIGEITWGNPINYQHFASFQIGRDFVTNQPIVFTRKQEDSFHFKRNDESLITSEKAIEQLKMF